MTKPVPEMEPDSNGNQNLTEQFAAHVAHDLNNLLTGILGNLELLQNRIKRSGVNSYDAYLEGARNASNRAASFALRLLAFSGQAAQEQAPVRVSEIIAQVTEAAAATGLRVKITGDAGAAMLFCDAAQFDLALHELLKNAATAVATSGTVTLSAAWRGHDVSLRIEDTGTGMSADDLARCRLPFFSTQPNGTGRGLGLPIAERFARGMGGTLNISSRPGHGTSVTMVLPAFNVP